MGQLWRSTRLNDVLGQARGQRGSFWGAADLERGISECCSQSEEGKGGDFGSEKRAQIDFDFVRKA